MKQIYTLAIISLLNLNFLKAQTALDFDPNSGLQQVEILGISCPDEFTIEAWINYRGQADSYPTILEFGDDIPFFGLEDDFLTLYDIIFSTSTIPLNEWVHVAVTFSTVNSEANLYINGVLDATETGVTLDISGAGAGIGYNGSDYVFNGSIDDLRIWNVVRSENEIFTNINICLNGSEIGLYAFYNFNEGSGTVVNDLTNNNFNGTLLNMDSVTDWISYDNCSTLSIDEQTPNSTITLFPNPSSDFIQISGLSAIENYRIYNVIGTEIINGITTNNEKINIQNINSGLYFLKFENGNTIKFLKE